MVTHIDPSIRPIIRSKLTRTLIPPKLDKTATYVSSLLDGVRCVVIYYDLWMSKTTQNIFSMTAHFICENVREHAHIGMPITILTDGESLAVPVGNMINQFSVGSKPVDITSYGGTNLEIYKRILESTFDNTGVFDLGKPFFCDRVTCPCPF